MSLFTQHTMETAPAKSKELLEGIQKGYGFVPNLFWYMAEAPATIDAYLHLNKLISESSLTPAQQQLSLLAVSTANNCDFCSVAHAALGKMNDANQQTIDAIRINKEIEDASDRALVDLARSFVNNKGWVPEAEIEDFLHAGFSKQQVFEVILTVSIKTLSNYVNHLTQPEANPELLAML